MAESKTSPPARVADGLDDGAFLGGNCSPSNAPKAQVSQEKNSPSPAVAAAIERNQMRLLAIKRGSIGNFLCMIDASLELAAEAIEN